MSEASDLQDRRRAAVNKVEERMVGMLVSDHERFGKLRVEDVHEIAMAARNYAWDALLEMAQ